MLVLELVDGESMLDKILKATDRETDTIQRSLLPPEEFRLRVLKNIFDAEIAIWWDAEILHTDQSPRNVIVRDDGSVVIVDFNQAYIYRFVDHDQHPKYHDGEPKLPPSPIEHYWPLEPSGSNMAGTEEGENPWANWIPPRWIQDKELAAEWLLETWKDASPGQYRPLSENFLNHPAIVNEGAGCWRCWRSWVANRLGSKQKPGAL